MFFNKNIIPLFVICFICKVWGYEGDTLMRYSDWKSALKVKDKVYFLEYDSDKKDKSVNREILKFKNLHTIAISSASVRLDEFFKVAATMPKLRKLIIYNSDKDSLKQLYLLKQITSLEICFGLNTVPSSVIALTQLEELKISSNLTALPENICNLKKLKVLNLESNDISELPYTIGRLTDLRALYLYGNELLSVPDSIQNLNLSTLKLEMSESVDSFPSALLKIKSLESLNITQKNLKELPTQFNNLENLRDLTMNVHLRMAWVKTFTTLSTMPNLITLNLFQYAIYPKEIALLKNIKHLEVSADFWSNANGASIYVLDNICGLKHLESLVFNLYRDTVISPQIKKLEHLKSLEFRNSFLTQLPEEIGNLSQLRKLVINRDANMPKGRSRNFKLPIAIKNLKKLQHLSLRSLPIHDLPAGIGGLEMLQYADFRHCQIHSIPASMGALHQLEELELGFNSLNRLPVGFGDLQKLKRLMLYRNEFTKFDPELIKLKNLEFLEMGYQPMDSVPASIHQLQNLVRLDLQETFVKTLPASIQTMDRLKEIFLCEEAFKMKWRTKAKTLKKIVWSEECHYH